MSALVGGWVMQIELYAIKHKPTGYFLPSRKGRGYSHDEPQPNGGKLGPRLFFSRIAARNALTAWLMGTFAREVSLLDFEGNEVESDLIITPQPHRKREEMKVVVFRAKEQTHVR